MASRFTPSGAGRTTSAQTIEVQHQRLSPVDSGTAKAIHTVPNVEERFKDPKDLFPKPQRSSNQKVEGNTPQQLDDHDPKYNLEFSLNGFPNVHNHIYRHELLEKLTTFIGQQPTDARKTVFLVGKSGFGKTQLAITYAQNSKKKIHSATFFIDAATKSTLNQSFAFILQEQLWDHWPDVDLDRPGTPPSDDQSVRSIVHQWLSLAKNKKWLLIFDNASDPELLIPYLPPKGLDQGTVIITTQSSRFTSAEFLEKNVPGQSREIVVGGLAPKDGEKLLVYVAGDAYQETDTDTRIILNGLEWCPCKIVQFARAVGNDGGVNPVYRGIIKKTLAGENSGDELFNTACTRLLNDLGTGNKEAHHDARKLLLLFRYFHPQDIWYGLVRQGQIDPGPRGEDHWLQRSTHSPLKFKERVRILVESGFVAVDSMENLESARITIHDRLLKFLLEEELLDRERLRIAASCVAYSNCGDYHPQLYEIRTRLMPHVHAIRKHLEDNNEYGLRHFHFDKLEPGQQVIVRQMIQDEKDLSDDYIGFRTPFSELAYLLAWDTKTPEAQQFIKKAYKSLELSISDTVKAHWNILIAHLLYFGENPNDYPLALRCTELAIRILRKSERDIRAFLFAKRLEIALKSKWGLSEEKASALKDNEDVVLQVRSVLPNTVYFLDTLDDSALILLENELFDRSAERYSECFEYFRKTKLPISHRVFATLAAKSAISTPAEKVLYLKTATTEEEKAVVRLFMAEKAWEGFKNLLEDDDLTTITQARILAQLYDEEERLEDCIKVRGEIIVALQRVGTSDPIDQAKEHKFLAQVLLKKNYTLKEDDEELFRKIKETLDEGLKLIQLAHVEKDEKVLALQFGIAVIFYEIYEYSAALPILQQILTSLKSIKNHSQSNMNIAMDQLSAVYYKLGKPKRADLDNLLADWPEPEILSNDASAALETWKKKAKACMDYDFHERAIPLLKRIQSYLTSLPESQQTEVLENRYQLAVCLELTDQIPEALEMYKSILNSFDGKLTFDTSERLLRSRVFEGLGDIHHSREERPLAASMFQNALEEVEACEDRKNSDVRYHEARILYDIAQVEWDIYFFDDHDPTVSARARERFEKVLTFQDSNCRWILGDNQIGRTFFYLGFIDMVHKRPMEAEKNLRNSLTYLTKELPPAISSIESSYHLLFLSLWEQLGDPETNKLVDLFVVMIRLLANFGLFDSLEPNLNEVSIVELFASEWTLSKNIPKDVADFALKIISDSASILNAAMAPQISHRIFLKVLRTCEELFGLENWRTRNALFLLEENEEGQFGASDSNDSVYITQMGLLLTKAGGTQREVWSDPGPWSSQSPASPDEILSDDRSKILVRVGKWKLAIAKLNPELKDRLIYNPPPDTSGWPQSWTFMPNVAKLKKKEERLYVPLRIANAPVIIAAPKRYPTVWSSIPPKDSHDPIDPAEPLSAETIIDIFQEYDFAQGFFLLLNRRLQIVVNNEFNYSEALAKKPIVFGGLKVDYVRNIIVHTTTPSPERVKTKSTHDHFPELRINTTIIATRFRRPILGLFGKAVVERETKIARIGVRVRPKKKSDRDKDLLTIPTHAFKKTLNQRTKSSNILSPLRVFSGREGSGVKVFEESTRQQIGTVAAERLELDGSYTLAGNLAPDISLVSPLRQEDIANIESPVPDLGWIADEDWDMLKGTAHQTLKILGADEIKASGIRSKDGGRQNDCAIIGEGFFQRNNSKLEAGKRKLKKINANRLKVGRVRDPNEREDSQELKDLMLSINRCLLFRVPDWGALERPGSGTGIYTTFPGAKSPALVGFVSFEQPALDEGIQQEDFDAKDMDDDDFSNQIQQGTNVAFWGAWKLPQKLSKNYEIVCVPQATVVEDTQPL